MAAIFAMAGKGITHAGPVAATGPRLNRMSGGSDGSIKLPQLLDDCLRWRSAQLSAHIARRAVQIVANDLPEITSYVGEQIEQEERARGVLDEMEQLPSLSRLRILTAPETSRQLYKARKNPTGEFLNQIQDWVSVERIRGGGEGVGRGDLWTALGDQSYSAIGGEPAALSFEAPQIAGRIVLDFHSPWRYRSKSLVADQRESWVEGPPFLAEQHRWLTAAIDDAMTQLSQSSHVAWEMVLNTTKVIAIVSRQDEERPFSSQSQRTLPGRTLLIFHSGMLCLAPSSVSARAYIADSLIHEAIHSAIYWLEIDQPLFEPGTENSQQMLRSPWSGNLLAPQTFVHACFVWCALQRFWIRKEAGAVFGEQEAEAQEHRATASIDVIRATIAPIWNCLNPIYRRALEMSWNEA